MFLVFSKIYLLIKLIKIPLNIISRQLLVSILITCEFLNYFLKKLINYLSLYELVCRAFIL